MSAPARLAWSMPSSWPPTTSASWPPWKPVAAGRAHLAPHPTGTDRIAEVAAQLTCDIVVNVQGDEPGIAPQAIDALVQPLFDDPSISMSTLARPCAMWLNS